MGPRSPSWPNPASPSPDSQEPSSRRPRSVVSWAPRLSCPLSVTSATGKRWVMAVACPVRKCSCMVWDTGDAHQLRLSPTHFFDAAHSSIRSKPPKRGEGVDFTRRHLGTGNLSIWFSHSKRPFSNIMLVGSPLTQLSWLTLVQILPIKTLTTPHLSPTHRSKGRSNRLPRSLAGSTSALTTPAPSVSPVPRKPATKNWTSCGK